MSEYVLDTDHLSLFQRRHLQVTARVLAHPATHLAVTIITVEEQLRGRLSQIRRASSRLARMEGYARLHEALDFFVTIRLLDFDEMADIHCEALRQQRIRIGVRDLRIAATVLAIGGALITRNTRDFGLIPSLPIEDWSRP